MAQTKKQILFDLLRSAIRGTEVVGVEWSALSEEERASVLSLAKRHDVVHLLVFALKQNGLLAEGDLKTEARLLNAVYRYERLNYEYLQVCEALEAAEVSYMPLKGSILRGYYPEEWMRTSCDVDILVHKEDLERAIAYLVQNLGYSEKEHGTHDVSLFAPSGIHIELHFDLVEEGRAQNAIHILSSVWENAILCEASKYRYEMTDAFFYFYHIAHMAKHFETGGCGIRPFIDLFILDRMENADREGRDKLLERGGLLPFANVSRDLSEVWFDGKKPDALLLQTQNFILHGGVYGSSDNRVALWQKKRGGKVGYLISRLFIPLAKLKRYYPILEKHPWLMPVMQIRRWFMLLRPDVAKMARSELKVNQRIDSARAAEMDVFLDNIGL